MLAALLSEPQVAEPNEDSPETLGLIQADALLVPTPHASLAPVVLAGLGQSLPVLAPGTPEGEELLGTGGAFVSRIPTAIEWLNASRRLQADPAERKAVIRREHAHARRRFRRPASGSVVSAPEAGQQAFPMGCPPARGVTAVIPTRGGPRVRRCVYALRRAAGSLPLQVVLVVTGGVGGMLPPADDIARAEPPFSWSKATNAGLRLARHPYVLLLNDDCYFQGSGDLQRMVERLERCGHLIATAPRGTGFPAHWEQTTLPPNVGIRETRFTLCGACILVRREAFWIVGGFDERFETYGCDEMDWFYRARAEGYRWGIDTAVSVEHEWSASYGEERRQTELPASMQLFRELHGIEGVDGHHWDSPVCAASWVIAARNGAGHLARCLGSIAAHRSQFPEDSEVVLAIDGADDPSVQVARHFNASLSEPLPLRIHVFPEPADTPGRAKNRALRLARGEVHLPLDVDDATLPGRAQLLAALDDADVAVGNFWAIGVGGEIQEKRPGPITLDHLLRTGAQNWGLWATAIRRETWAQHGLHHEALPSTEDLELWLRWLREGVRFRQVHVPVHLYLLRPGSTVFTHDTGAVEEALREAFRGGEGTCAMGLRST
jgi:glycosyltransferase involved in cell wall biosynthesis